MSLPSQDGDRLEGLPRLAEGVLIPMADHPGVDVLSPYDGRYTPLDPAALGPLVSSLVGSIGTARLDAVLAICERDIAAAFAFAAAAGLPLVVATKAQADLPQAIRFQVADDHERPIEVRHVYALVPGDRVVVVEHQTLTATNILWCVNALRARDVECDLVASVLVADDPLLLARLSAASIRLGGAMTIPTAVSQALKREPGRSK